MSRHFKIHLGTALLTIVILAINYSEFSFIKPYDHSWNDILIIILAGQNVLTTYLVIQKSQARQGLFPIFVIVSFIFRLLVAMMIMALAWLLEVDQIETLAINLLVLYLVFLAFELYTLLTNLRPNSDKGPN